MVTSTSSQHKHVYNKQYNTDDVYYNTLAASYNTDMNRYTSQRHTHMNIQHSTRTNSVQFSDRGDSCSQLRRVRIKR